MVQKITGFDRTEENFENSCLIIRLKGSWYSLGKTGLLSLLIGTALGYLYRSIKEEEG
jgi:hypothetical protein